MGDALFHAICLRDHANPGNDADDRDVGAAGELKKLSALINQHVFSAPEAAFDADRPTTKRGAAK